ncbi:MAG: carbohydrate kinase [Burkholderiales bacterium]|nr:carbohydrate kinase [Nitrosomonas sp.]MCP5276278.1 carbohydrate kinase [Burkholderiales bacterium]
MPTNAPEVAIALDLGTTSIKAALLDQHGELRNIVSQPAPEIEHQGERYESDALRYLESAEAALSECLANTESKPPLGLCSQRSSFLIWDKKSGIPVIPLISWQDSRGIHFYDEDTKTAKAERIAALIPALTGLRLTPYYFAPKLSVLLGDHPDWREKLIQGIWLAGTLDTFLIWRWSNGQYFCTDASMAARTLLMDIHRQQWSEELCSLFNIPSRILPRIMPSAGLNLPVLDTLMLQASVGDQSAALFASVMNDSSKALVNLGTGGFVIRCLKKDVQPLDGYLHTLVYQDRHRAVYMASEGTLNSIAAALAPYPFRTCKIDEFATNDILCLAEPSGLGAPYFSSHLGLCFSESTEALTTRQIAVLLLEAIVFRVVRILEDYHRQMPLTQVYLSGGLSELACLQQGIAQCVTFPVMYLQQKEASLLGTTLLATNGEIQIPQRVQGKKIETDRKNVVLIKKYQQWKIWLDTLL